MPHFFGPLIRVFDSPLVVMMHSLAGGSSMDLTHASDTRFHQAAAGHTGCINRMSRASRLACSNTLANWFKSGRDGGTPGKAARTKSWARGERDQARGTRLDSLSAAVFSYLGVHS